MSAPELITGSVVAGKYAIRSFLRHGGAMATYRASAPKNREVALKIYDPAIAKFPDVLKALAEHQSMGSKLASPPIVPIVDSGTDSNSGAPFTVTDFESRPSLAQLIDRGPLSASAMVALVRSLASATDLLHANGIASLSLHPNNVFVTPGAQSEVRIADLGATLVRSALPAPEKAPRWMPWLAPEQIKGQGPVSPAADVFAVGLIAFFAVTGKPYWRSSQLTTPDPAALRREILGERMPASVRAEAFSITLNPAVDAVFARALAFRPADRYATAREFAAGLEAALLGRPVAEAPPPEDTSAGAKRPALPPPRKMALRSTMLGVGHLNEEPAGTPPTTGGARPPMATMLGMGEAVAEAKAAAIAKSPGLGTALASAKGAPPAMPVAPPMPYAPAKVAPATKPAAPPLPVAAAKPAAPPLPIAPAKAAAPPLPIAPAKAAAPPLPIAPAKAAAPPLPPAAKPATPPPLASTAMFGTPVIPVAPAASAAPSPRTAAATSPVAAIAAGAPLVTPPSAAGPRGAPPPLPIAPPPSALLEEVLAQFEAAAPERSPAANAPTTIADIAQAPPAWAAPTPIHYGTEHVETGVGVVGVDLADAPKKGSRLRWIAAGCGLLILTGGAAWGLSGHGTSARDRAASDAKAVATVPTAAAVAPSTSAEAPSETAAPQAVDPVPLAEKEAVPEVAQPAMPPAVAAEPSAPAADNAVAQPANPTNGNAPNPAAQGGAPAAARPSGPKKPCGKFLKRCK